MGDCFVGMKIHAENQLLLLKFINAFERDAIFFRFHCEINQRRREFRLQLKLDPENAPKDEIIDKAEIVDEAAKAFSGNIPEITVMFVAAYAYFLEVGDFNSKFDTTKDE